MDPQDYDPADCEPDVRTFRTGTATARKHHKCCGCPAGVITPGGRYSYHVGIVEGAFEVERMCLAGSDPDGCDWNARHPKRRPGAPPPEAAAPMGPDDLPF